MYAYKFRAKIMQVGNSERAIHREFEGEELVLPDEVPKVFVSIENHYGSIRGMFDFFFIVPTVFIEANAAYLSTVPK